MKTSLPEKIDTVEQAKNFLRELHKNGETFHPEDDAHTIVWETAVVSESERNQLNKLTEDIYNLEGNQKGADAMVFDPCWYLLNLQAIDEMEVTEGLLKTMERHIHLLANPEEDPIFLEIYDALYTAYCEQKSLSSIEPEELLAELKLK